MKKGKLILFVMTSIALISCAKEKEYDKVYKVPELQAKSAFKTHKEVIQKDGSVKLEPIKYLYVPMTLGTPREVREANPFYQGQEKVVRLQWAKEGLKVVAIETDERFQDNELNDTPVLTIPGDYQSFKCKEDSYGDCTNAEEEDKDREWDSKAYFKPNFKDLKVEEVNFLDYANVEADRCVTPNGVNLVDYEVSDGVINVELEKTYKLKNSWWCVAWNYFDGKERYNSFKVRFFYSIVELDQLATPGYKPVSYPTTDHSVYGFFKNEKEVLADNFDPSRKEDEILLNRWAPNRKNNELVYYLSKSFNKPENKPLLDATLRSARIMNKGFADAGMKFKLKMVQQKDDEKEISPGDLRYNTVVLIDDPLANGLLGYGPSVTNPYTGEIVQAHTNMYGGVLTSTVRRAYESAVDLSIDRAGGGNKKKMENIKLAQSAIKDLPATLVQDIVPSAASSVQPAPGDDGGNARVAHNHEGHAHAFNQPVIQDIDSNIIENMKHFLENESHKSINQKQRFKHLEEMGFDGLNEIEKRAKQVEAHERGYHLKTEHAPEFFEIGGTIKHIPEEIFAVSGILANEEKKILKRWDLLTKSQKDKVKEIILVHSYTATFIHEIGHNLGLRHNFSGSWDKENFYTKEEALALGMKEVPAYSSVMDYSFSEFNQLAALGKYDIAALRFAYTREVETTEVDETTGKNKTVPVKTTYTDLQNEARSANISLKSYQFCTDENAGLSTTCNRFDEGTSLVEVVKHKIKRYEDAYKYRNFRDGRKSFNTYGLPWYTIARYREFSTIRDVVEDYQVFVDIFGKPVMEQGGCSEAQANNPQTKEICAMIKDRIDSVALVGKMFVDIIKTPDLTCAVAAEAEPTTIVALENLAEVYDKVKYAAGNKGKYIITSCFDEEIKSHFKEKKQVVVGENGKFLNSVRGTDPKNKYASDRDVRGTWVDKALAMRMLFDRVSGRGSNDENNGALVDIPVIARMVGPLLAHIATGTPLANPLPFKTEDGKEFSIPYILSGKKSINQVEHYFGWIKGFFNMPRNGKANLNEVVLKQLVAEGLSLGDEVLDTAYSMANFATVRKNPSLQQVNRQLDGYVQHTVGNYVYSASEENTLARSMLLVIDGAKTFGQIDVKLLQRVYKQRTNPELPEDVAARLTDDIKAFFSLDLEVQDQLIGLAAQGAPIPENAFINAFGEELGKLIFKAYGEGAEVLQAVKSLKLRIMGSIPSDITEPEQKKVYEFLLKSDLNTLKLYSEGKVNNELIDYYRGQLKRLPRHQQYTNI